MHSRRGEEQELLIVAPPSASQPSHVMYIVATAGLVGFGVVLGLVLAPAVQQGKQLTHARISHATLFQELAENGSCVPPQDFCQSDEGQDVLVYRDCDGDGILDAYCEGFELLRFGFLSSKNNCNNTWPSGLCNSVTMGRSSAPVPSTEKRAATNEITIIHFNDVYSVAGVLEKERRSGGMSRAMHVVNRERERNPERTFTVFAGDLLSPSVLSNIYEGKQMIDVLNAFKLDAASLGNHEFDFGVDTLTKRMGESEFPWLNINLLDETGELLPNTTKRLVKSIKFAPTWDPQDVKEIKMCFFGVAYDVRMSLSTDVERIGFRDVIPESKAEAEYLRKNESCDVVVALTHQLEKEDCALSAALGKSVDLILGGHDHSTAYTSVCGHAPFAKAASDLKTQWIMTLWLDEHGKVESVDGRLISLTDADPFDESMHTRIVNWETEVNEALGKPIGCFKDAMDASSAKVRTSESAVANFVTDAMRSYFKTDIAFVNGGGIRGNKVYQPGSVSRKILMEIDPFSSDIAKIYITGKQIKDFLNSQLNCIEELCGDLSHVSGLRYTIDSSKPVGERLVKVFEVKGDVGSDKGDGEHNEVEDEKEYTMAINMYQLSNSPMKKNKLYRMVTKNDAQPLITALEKAIKKGGPDCYAAITDGRLQDVA